MSLVLYNYENKNLQEELLGRKVIKDVEQAFKLLKVEPDEVTCRFIREIEKGAYKDSNRFINRFGTEVYLSELSVGCKAALCTHYLKDSVIDTKECGQNARDSIINTCTTGSIIFYDMGITIDDFDKDEIDVTLEGNTFTSVKALNNYIYE